MITDKEISEGLDRKERGYLNVEETKAQEKEAKDHLELERKQDLAVLQLMIDTPIEDKVAKAAEIGLPWEEYLRLISKYKHVIKRYEEEQANG